MKYKLSLIMVLSLSLFLSGCGFDESVESTQQRDGDDMNVIQDIGPQALDQMLRGERAIATLSQSGNVSVSPIVLPTPTRKKIVQPSNNQSSSTTTSQVSEIVPQPTPVVIPPTISPNTTREEDDSREGDD